MTSAPKSRWLVIVNPVSNRGATAACVSGMTGILNQQNIAFDLLITQRKNHAFELAAEKAAQYELMVAVGGDGTVHEIINGLLRDRALNQRNTPLPVIGVIPAGSGNDFVKVLGIPVDLFQSIQIIMRGQLQTVDIGRITIDGADHGFFNNNVGIGFDAHVNYENTQIKAIRGMAAYLSAVIKTIFRYKHPRVKISWDSQDLTKKVLLINTGIGRCSGGGFYLTPDAVLDDGLFDICVIESINKLKIMKELPKALDGSHTRLKEVRMFRTNGLMIESDQGLPVHADGEMLSMNAKSIRLSMIPEKIKVIRGS